MSAYLIASGEVTDPVLYEQYRAQVPALIFAHGGRYLVRGGATTLLEGGSGDPGRQVVLEFPSMAQLRAFYDSPEYAPLIALRQRAARLRILAVEGVPPAV